MEITVSENRRVSIRAINQRFTYAGLLEGHPYDEMNDRRIASALKEAAQKFGVDEVVLIEPIRTPIAYEGTYRLGKPERLPEILCMAELRDYQPARDSSSDYSELAVVWFQDDFAFPIQAAIIEQFSKIPWANVAGDCWY